MWTEVKSHQGGEEQAAGGGHMLPAGAMWYLGWTHAAAEGNIWAQEPTKAGICANVCDLLLLKAIWMSMIWATTWGMLMSTDHVASRAFQTWVACAVT